MLIKRNTPHEGTSNKTSIHLRYWQCIHKPWK